MLAKRQQKLFANELQKSQRVKANRRQQLRDLQEKF